VNAQVLESPTGARGGDDLKALLGHARRMRTLMRYVPRRYDMGIVEVLALAGVLDPAIGDADRQTRLQDAVSRIGRTDSEAEWTARV
ncbi:hypothetical protein NL393_35840, partial [Klebsiella pneumoniae]|nr:hypothetical protein [Klebsiella pneumoniae]